MVNKDRLSDRQRQLLSIVISEFIHSATPVSSLGIAKMNELGVSPATIRNDLGVLEDMGYITHPHTSAARLPTDEGYRYFVDHLLDREEISRDMALKIASMFKQRSQSIDELMRNASKLLSSLTEEAGLIVIPKMESQHFKKVTIVPLDELRWVVVWISTSGMVWHSTLELNNPIEGQQLDRLAKFLNEELEGLAYQKIEAHLMTKLKERKDSLVRLYELAMKLVRESLKISQELRLFLEGSKNVLDKPEFNDLEKSRKMISFFDSKNDLLRIFDEEFQSHGLNIHIGMESRLEKMRDCSLVTSTYQLKDDSTGILAVLGPKRMNYSKVISLVEYMSKEMADVLYRYF